MKLFREAPALFCVRAKPFVRRLSSAFCLALLISGGCRRAAEPAQPSVLVSDEPTEAQPRLQSLKLWLGPAEIQAEVALTEQEVRTGMMFRTNMLENEGMVFVFSDPMQVSFWMKNTLIPLSAAYMDPSGAILEIHNLKPLDTNNVTATSQDVQFVLETRQGWFDRHHVGTGVVVRTSSGSLRETLLKQF
jgi:hypothetical protein